MDIEESNEVNVNQAPIIGVGASAGGLEAVSQLLSHLTPGLHHALVILQHLSPNYKSMMAELLTRETRLVVEELADHTLPQPGVVYVVPPNKNAHIEQGELRLSDAIEEISPKPSIDSFLSSLAHDQGEQAIGIVLSGTGSDGTAGLRAIQVAGGLTIAQAPESAKYSGMPHSAIESQSADLILTPQAIAEKLLSLTADPDANAAVVPKSVLEQLLQHLKQQSGVDFSGYKAGTLTRRVRRRMVATNCQSMETYLALVAEHPEELSLLEKDILISVTSFFRDIEAFAALKARVKQILSDVKENCEIRAWVAGCATGEEAYSLAMLINEEKHALSLTNPVQVFATDIDENALNIARQGIYSQTNLGGLNSELAERYFSQTDDQQYEVNKNLRDMIVFARHNLVDDPPFLRLDLISCRNVMIYFDNLLQTKVLQRFHFSLKAAGTLFLGRSESVAQTEQLFSAYNRRERIFLKQGEVKTSLGTTSSGKLSPLPRLRVDSPQVLLDAITKELSVTAALCTMEGRVLQTSGDVNRFFSFPSGSSEMMLSDIIIPQFQGELLSQLHRLRKSYESQRSHPVSLFGQRWQIFITYIEHHPENRLLLAISKLPQTITEEIATTEAHFDDELQVTREQLQSLIEELATANEEMQSLNEEAQASNEELQATNEEMEAANEELQATNEELVSLNEELSVKTTELTLLNEEYSHLYDSFDFPVLVFDNDRHLIRFNAPASLHFHLKMNATNMHVSRLKFPRYLDELESYLDQVVSHGQKAEFLLENNDLAYQLIISPGIDCEGEAKFLVVNLVDITEIRDAENQLNESENRLKTLMENTTVLISMKDLSGNYLYANDAFLKAFEIDPNNYENRSDFDLFPESYASKIWSNDLEAIRRLKVVESEAQLLNGDQVRVYRNVHQVLRDFHGKPNLIITEAEDITARKQAEDKLRIAARVFQQAGEAIVVTDRASQIQSVNEAFTDITGYSEQDAMGQKIGRLLNSGRHSKDFFQDMWQALETRGHWQGEIWNKRKNGEAYPEWLTINRITNIDNETEYFIAVFSDITNLKESQRKVEFLATHDALTGLPNRNLFQDRLENAVTRCKRNRSSLAVMFIDLDDFKSINDTLGHDIGDQLLIKVARKLQNLVRDIDTVSRLGGDEFTIVLSECNPHEVQFVANRILDELSDPVDIGGRKIFASASIGISIYPDDGGDSGTLLKSADTAMYKSKEMGRNQYQFFHPAMRDRLLKQSAMESSIKNAIRLKRFRLVFQPKYHSCCPEQISGAEALLRWYEPNLGEISPAEFIPVAESNGSIIDLSNLVIEMLVEQVARWRNQGIDVPEIAFNVSARSFQQESFVVDLTKVMEAYMVPQKHLKIEITEGTVMEKNAAAINNIQLLRDLDMAVSIDDFGTGYSSLSYLKQLPITELKIDKSFVDGLGVDENDEAISKAILSMATALGLDVVAEGVETKTQLNWLQDNGCNLVQGFLFSKPLEVANFERLLILKKETDCPEETDHV